MWPLAMASFLPDGPAAAEAALGRRDRMMVAQYPADSPERTRITAAMSRPSVFDSFLSYLTGQGYDVPADVRARDVTQPLQA